MHKYPIIILIKKEKKRYKADAQWQNFYFSELSFFYRFDCPLCYINLKDFFSFSDVATVIGF